MSTGENKSSDDGGVSTTSAGNNSAQTNFTESTAGTEQKNSPNLKGGGNA